MKTTPQNQKVMDLIEDARKGELVLPQFQRNFVWARDDINDLLTSMLQSHFIGSFLFLETDKDNVPFSIRALEGIKLLERELKPDNMILDGQQRLTSINYALSAPDIPVKYSKYPFRYYLDLKKITAGDLENAFWNDYSENAGKRLEREYQFTEKLIPATLIEQWDSWLDEYEIWLVENDKSRFLNEFLKVDKPAWNNAIKGFKDFIVPTISITKFKPDDPEGLGHVCVIFEKLNSTGVKLSVYDLLTARMYKYGIDIHKMWEQAVDTKPLLAQFSEGKPDFYGVHLIRTIALLRGVEVRSKTLINLNKENFENDWNIVVNYTEKALHRLSSVDSDGFGVFSEKWMPYSTMISPLTAMLYEIDHQKMDHNAFKLMRRWYWSSVFRERYAGAVESTMMKDFQDFKKAVVDAEYEPESIREARLNILENKSFSLVDVNRINSIYRGVMCLIALNGAKDFKKDDSITFHDLEDHHIFPKAYLEDLLKNSEEIKKDYINCIVNRTLIADRTNNEIRKKQPSKYLSEIIPMDYSDQILKSHFIDEKAKQNMLEDDFLGFLHSREISLIKIICKKISKG